MNDGILEGFLNEQRRQGLALAEQSDLIELFPIDLRHYLVRFHCKGLVRSQGGEIVEASGFEVGISFPEDHLRQFDPAKTLTWLHPLTVWHPNVRPPFVCTAHLPPGLELTDILFQLYDIIVYNNYATHDALNAEAGQWARNQAPGRFPVDRRPLKRRHLAVRVEPEVQPS